MDELNSKLISSQSSLVALVCKPCAKRDDVNTPMATADTTRLPNIDSLIQKNTEYELPEHPLKPRGIGTTAYPRKLQTEYYYQVLLHTTITGDADESHRNNEDN